VSTADKLNDLLAATELLTEAQHRLNRVRKAEGLDPFVQGSLQSDELILSHVRGNILSVMNALADAAKETQRQ